MTDCYDSGRAYDVADGPGGPGGLGGPRVFSTHSHFFICVSACVRAAVRGGRSHLQHRGTMFPELKSLGASETCRVQQDDNIHDMYALCCTKHW